MFFTYYLLLISTIVSAQVSKSRPAQAPDKVVLTVGDEKVTIGEYEKFLDTLPEHVRANAMGAGKRQIADQLARVKVLAQEARKRKLEQDPAFKVQLASFTESLLAATLYRDLSMN